MRVLTYTRVSTEDQTVEPQDMELQRWAVAGGHTIVGTYSDMMSGTKESRPGLNALLERCKGREQIDAVVCVKLDRIARSVLNFSRIMRLLEKENIALVCTSQGIDTTDSNPCGRLMRDILSAFAAFEREVISERTKAGLAAAKKRGVKLGKGSKKLIQPEYREVVLNKFQKTKKVSYRKLAVALGGVSISTAYKLMQDHKKKSQQPEIVEVT